LEELKALKDGWLDGSGKAPPPEGLDWLASVLTSRYPPALPLPYAYPVENGGIQLEWSIKHREISLEVDLSTKSGQWHALDLDTNDEEVERLDLASEAGWSWAVDRLGEIAGAAL
jgi:hypothetical protein